MSSFRTPYIQGEMPQVALLLGTSDAQEVVLGDVDSGADRSLFPLEIAEALGIRGEDLVPDKKLGGGAGKQTFQTWSSKLGINGQVIEGWSDGSFVLWGDLFAMKPAFADTEDFLLGRKDFFAAFSVKFLNEAKGCVLEIET